MSTPDDAPPPSSSEAAVPVVVVEAPAPHPAPDAAQLGLVEQFKAFWLALMDPTTSKLSKVAVGVAVLYLVSPIDLLPEALLAIFGLVDDMAAFGFLAHAIATLPTEAHRRAIVAQRGGGAAPAASDAAPAAAQNVLPAVVLPARPAARRSVLPLPGAEPAAPAASLTQPFTTALSALARGLALFGMGLGALALVLSIGVAWFFFSRPNDASNTKPESATSASQVIVPASPAVPSAAPASEPAPTATPAGVTPGDPATSAPAASAPTAKDTPTAEKSATPNVAGSGTSAR